jgi:PAS domain-containing protein
MFSGIVCLSGGLRLTQIEQPESAGSAEDVCKLQEELEDSENRYRCLFEGSKDMIFITFKDGAFQDVNPAAVELLGYDSKAELLSVGSAEKVYHNTMHWRVFQRQIDREGFVKDFEAKFKSSAIRALPRISPPAWTPFAIFDNATMSYWC